VDSDIAAADLAREHLRPNGVANAVALEIAHQVIGVEERSRTHLPARLVE
jgi:hypothetical protein